MYHLTFFYSSQRLVCPDFAPCIRALVPKTTRRKGKAWHGVCPLTSRGVTLYQRGKSLCLTFNCYVKEATHPTKQGKRGFGRLPQTVIQSSTPTQKSSEGVSISPRQTRRQAGKHRNPSKMAKFRQINTLPCADWK